MIRYALSCDHGHEFDAWFASGDTYDDQARGREIICPCCGSATVTKAPMAPAVRTKQAEPPPLFGFVDAAAFDHRPECVVDGSESLRQS